MRGVVWLSAVLAIAACSSSSSTGGTGGEGGSGPTGGSQTGATNPGASGGGSGPVGDGGVAIGQEAGATILCQAENGSCICGKDPQWFAKGTATTPCSRATTSPDAWCCAANAWPASGGCSCSKATPSCHLSAFKDTCICSLAELSAGETVVPSCSGTLCCNEPGDIAPTCACYKNVSKCVWGTPVPSCTVASLKCEGHTTNDCR